jgi:hypothetical protein
MGRPRIRKRDRASGIVITSDLHIPRTGCKVDARSVRDDSEPLAGTEGGPGPYRV